MCSFESSLVVSMNSSIGSLFEFVWNLLFYFVFSAISYSYAIIFARNYICACQSLGCHVLVPKPDDDVYEEVVKPFLEEARP